MNTKPKAARRRWRALVAPVITCPSCKRGVFTRRDLLYATLDGMAQCGSCGRIARLDVSIRWIFSCVLAIILPNVLLYGGVFYSGHLFLVSTFLILGAWGILSWVGFPFLTLEVVPGGSPVDRRKSILILLVFLVSVIIIDSYMRTRFE